MWLGRLLVFLSVCSGGAFVLLYISAYYHAKTLTEYISTTYKEQWGRWKKINGMSDTRIDYRFAIFFPPGENLRDPNVDRMRKEVTRYSPYIIIAICIAAWGGIAGALLLN
jgi:hypothetical protein